MIQKRVRCVVVEAAVRSHAVDLIRARNPMTAEQNAALGRLLMAEEDRPRGVLADLCGPGFRALIGRLTSELTESRPRTRT